MFQFYMMYVAIKFNNYSYNYMINRIIYYNKYKKHKTCLFY